MAIRIEVCETNLLKHASTAAVFSRIQREFPEVEFAIEYLEMKCGGICGICKNTPYALVSKKFITGMSADSFYDNLKRYLTGLLAEDPVA
ncbi:DUF1450 domain-containing protein [Effusibacillus pohliae]|uniref:DUF1450 domain-containing protein n=1 Tax=Effusibacillus pohliae TaxID=232270 RepID=UPI000376BC66|nr:DUF1450 domain-containing protein [Effusibacillus pohliae]